MCEEVCPRWMTAFNARGIFSARGDVELVALVDSCMCHSGRPGLSPFAVPRANGKRVPCGPTTHRTFRKVTSRLRSSHSWSTDRSESGWSA